MAPPVSKNLSKMTSQSRHTALSRLNITVQFFIILSQIRDRHGLPIIKIPLAVLSWSGNRYLPRHGFWIEYLPLGGLLPGSWSGGKVLYFYPSHLDLCPSWLWTWRYEEKVHLLQLVLRVLHKPQHMRTGALTGVAQWVGC